jgi:asparagine synthase (glutamine-hydrolysing)
MALGDAECHLSWLWQNPSVKGCPQQWIQGIQLIKLSISPHALMYSTQVALSGEGADEIFAGYSWFLLDYLRRPDPAAAGLGIPLPTEEERRDILANMERSAGAHEFTTVNVTLPESGLIKIGSHHVTATLIPFYGPTFKPEIIEVTGEPEIARAIVEGMDPRVRQNSISDTWHSLNVALVYSLVISENLWLTIHPQYMTAKTFLGRIILNQVGDRADMVNAVENRVSYLDHHLVEYVNTLPPYVLFVLSDAHARISII